MAIDLTKLQELRAGINDALTRIQSGLQAEVFAEKLPIIGDQLKSAVGGEDALKQVQALQTVVDTAFGVIIASGDFSETKIEAELNSAIKAANFATGDFVNFTDLSDGNYTLAFSADKSTNVFNTSLDSNFGLPGIDLHTTGDVDVSLNYSLDLMVGVDGSGFYLDTTAPQEFSLKLDVTAPDFTAGGSTLGFIDFAAVDQGSYLQGTFGIDLQDGDNKIRLNEFSVNNIDATFTGEARIDIDLSATSDIGFLPEVSTTLTVDWDFDTTKVDPGDGNTFFGTKPVLKFSDVTYDFGETIDNVIAPALHAIVLALEPVNKALDIFRADLDFLQVIPGFLGKVDKAGGTTKLENGTFIDAPDGHITLIDFLKLAAPDQSFVGTTNLVNTVDLILDVAGFLDSKVFGGTNAVRNIGSFEINDDIRGVFNAISMTATAIETADDVLQFVDSLTGGVWDDKSDKNLSFGAALHKFVTADDFSFALPTLTDPQQALRLLLGGDSDLFALDLPALNVPLSPSVLLMPQLPVPLLPGVFIELTGRLGMAIDLAFGIDTSGLHNGKFFDGFFLSDEPGAEFMLEAAATLALVVPTGIPGTDIGGGGTISGKINLDLNDQIGDGKIDGKIYFPQITADPFELFDASGLIQANFTAFIRVLGYDLWRYNSPRITLGGFSFNDDPGSTLPDPHFGEINGNKIQLNFGDSADQRAISNKVDGDEGIEITKGSVKISAYGRQDIIPDAGITEITAQLGKGDDRLEVSEDITLPVIADGGADNDIIYGGGGDDTLSGGTGHDWLYGRAGHDTLKGDEGLDVLDGGAGADDFFGGEGNDLVTYENSPDGLTLDLTTPGNSTGEAAGDTFDSIEAWEGSAKNDTLIGKSGTQSFFGKEGDDKLYGMADSDNLGGNAGDDYLDGGLGDDVLGGGAGNDTYVVDSFGDDVSETAFGGTEGNPDKAGTKDRVITTLDDYSLSNTDPGQTLDQIEELELTGDLALKGTGNALDNLIIGQGKDNELHGAGGKDTIQGNGGDDKLYGDAGEDTLEGGVGNDILEGGADNDFLTGEANDDFLDGGAGNDILEGGAGVDILDGGAGNDKLIGGADNDIYLIDDSNDEIVEGVGDTGDSAIASADYKLAADDDIETLSAASGSDPIKLTGNALDQTLNGNDGNNWLEGLGGADKLFGGEGTDTASYEHSNAAVEIDLALAAVDRFKGGDAEGDTIDSIEVIEGSDHGDKLYGTDGPDIILKGLGGADELDGRAGDDHLFGDEGDDHIFGDEDGGSGADTIDGGGGTDTVDYSKAGKSLTADLTANSRNTEDAKNDTYTNVENLIGTDKAGAGDELVGDSVANKLEGLDGDDVLIGNGGGDELIGGEGTDTASYRDSGFVSSYDAAFFFSDIPTANDYHSGVAVVLKDASRNNVEFSNNEAAGDTYDGIENLEGGAGNDILFGDDNANAIDGGAGNDLLQGYGGGDKFVGGDGNDTVTYYEAAGAVTADLTSTDQAKSDENGETGEANDDTFTEVENLTGGDFNDTLRGDAGKNTLIGGFGDDVLEGRGGADFLDGGADTSDEEPSNHFVGQNWASYEHAEAGVTADLRNNVYFLNLLEQGITNVAEPLDGKGDAAGDVYHHIVNLKGSAFNDVLHGDDGQGQEQTPVDYTNGDNIIDGQGGDDILLGGFGADHFIGGTDNWTLAGFQQIKSYANFLSSQNKGDTVSHLDAAIGSFPGNPNGFGVTVNLANPSDTKNPNAGDTANGDTYDGIENLIGTEFNDLLIGNDGDNVLIGDAGGPDKIFVLGDQSDDVLVGGKGADTLIGGRNGPDEGDAASYFNASAGVTASLAVGTDRDLSQTTNTGDAKGDIYLGIENLIGSAYADHLIGNSGDNILDGGKNLDSGLGDTLQGGAGNDTYRVRNVNDVLIDDTPVLGLPNVVEVFVNDYTLSETINPGFVELQKGVVKFTGNSLNNANITGSDDGNVIDGGAGNDNIFGGKGDDTLTGGTGDDRLDGGAGADQFFGGTHSFGDSVSYSELFAGITIDMLNDAGNSKGATGDAAGDTFDGIENVIGTMGDDVIRGDDGKNTLMASSYLVDDDDVLDGRGGDDLLLGGGGADKLIGGTGNDTASYGNADTGVFASLATPARNTGHARGDTYDGIENLTGTFLADTLGGDAGSNILTGGNGKDTFLYDGRGDDVIKDFNKNLNGSPTEIIKVSAVYTQFSTLFAQAVNVGSDVKIAFGVGNSLTLENFSKAQLNTNQFIFAPPGITINGTAGNDVINGTVGIGALKATALGDTISGLAGDDTLSGLAGDDLLFGGDNNDTLDGGAGSDALDGGMGIDTATYAGTAAAVTATLGGTAVQGVDIDVLTDIENLTGGNAADRLTGDAKDNVIEGGAGADVLDGGEGDETAGDTLSYAAMTAAVTVNLGKAEETGANAGYILTGGDLIKNFENIKGGSGADLLTGDPNNNTIKGELGNDTIDGGAGNDVLDGGAHAASGDTVSYFSANNGVTVSLAIAAKQDTAGAGEDTLSGFENLTGSDNADTLTGDALANVIEGGKGDDTIEGGLGNDTLRGGANGADGDTVSYVHAASKVVVSLANLASQNTLAAGSDIISGFENITGSDFADELTGDGNANKLTGGKGDDLLEGGLGNDQLIGGDGNDTASFAGLSVAVTANTTSASYANNANTTNGKVDHDTLSGIENLIGGTGDDTLTGDDADNVIDGNKGNDILKGGSGAETLGDTLTYANIKGLTAAAGVTVDLSNTNKQNTGVGGQDTISGFENLTGTNKDDTLTGDDNANVIKGELGNDTIIGGKGDDVLDGGLGATALVPGSDTVSYKGASAGVTVNLGDASAQNTGGAGTDTLSGFENLTGSSNGDKLTGDDKANTIDGDLGDDTIDGGRGNDTLKGGGVTGNLGNDTVSYESATLGFAIAMTVAQEISDSKTPEKDTLSGFENITGSQFADTITGDGVANTLKGLGGKDVIFGNMGHDVLEGGDADDRLDGGLGNDRLDGGNGSDTASYLGFSLAVTANLALATPQATYKNGAVTETDTLVSIENLTGGNIADILTGDDKDNVIEGGVGADVLDGGEGDETGGDTVSYFGMTTAVTVNLGQAKVADGLANAGFISTGGDFIKNFENIIGGGGADKLTGDIAANIIKGEGGNDIIDGGAGEDTLLGGAGNDIIDGGAGNDALDGGGTLEAPGTDTVTYVNATTGVTVSLAGGTATDGVDTDTLSGFEDITGSSKNDILTGNDKANTIDGGLGDDIIEGGLGNDTLKGGGTTALPGVDTLTYASAAGPLGVTVSLALTGAQDVYSGKLGGGHKDTISGFENLTGSGFNDKLTGDGKNNTLTGGDGDDTLDGGLGNDTLNGGEGSDTIDGGAGNDILDGGTGTGIDLVSFTHAATSVSVDLTTKVANHISGKNIVQVDTISNFEIVFGSNFADVITGDALNNIIDGGTGGNDELTGGDNEAYGDTVSYALAGTGVVVDLSVSAEQDTKGGGKDKLKGFENLSGSAFNDVLAGTAGNNVMAGAAGVDTVSYANATAAVTIDFSAGAEQETGGAGKDMLFDFENITGSIHNDILTGDDKANTIDGGLGDDIIEGGLGNDNLKGGGTTATPGNDTVTYANATAGVTVSLLKTTAQITGGAGNDTLSGFENLTGSGKNDWLTGDTKANTLTGGDGDDVLEGGLGADVLNGGNGSDTASFAAITTAVVANLTSGTYKNGVNETDTFTSIENLTGGTAADTLTGDDKDNVIEGGLGADVLDGGEGDETGGDTVSYFTMTAAVTVNLGQAKVADGLANAGFISTGGDFIKNFENITGGGGADKLTGDIAANVIKGEGGNDIIDGGAGEDTLLGGAGNDTLAGGADNDDMDGGAGNDTLTGGAGSDDLTGGAGADRFVFDTTASSDDILDYKLAESDFIDVSALLPVPVRSQPIGNLVRLTDSGGNSSILEIDIDGSGAGGWAQIAELDGINSADGVKISLNGTTTTTTVFVRPSAPGFTLYTDDTGTKGDGITADKTPTVTGTADPFASVEAFKGATSLGKATADGAGVFTLTTSALADGDHNIIFKATNSKGLVSENSTTFAITIDTTTPEPTIDTMTDNVALLTGTIAAGGLTNDNKLELNGTAEAGSKVTIIDEETELGTATAGGDGKWTFTTGALADGEHSLLVKSTDVAGNFKVSQAQVVTVDTTAPDAPVIVSVTDDSNGTPGDGIIFDHTPTLSGTAEADIAIEVFKGATSLGKTTADENGDWSFTTDTLADGAHNLTVKAIDAAGNVASAALDLTITPSEVFDLTFLSKNFGFIVQGDAAGDQAGLSVSSAGDVNGDGFADLIVGAPLGDDGGTNAGEAYVVFGTASGFGAVDGTGRAVLDLSNVAASFDPAKGFIIQGDAAGDLAGWSVSSAGDVNGDGFADLIVGAQFGDDDGFDVGEAYVVFGTASGFGTVDIVTGRAVLDLSNDDPGEFDASVGFIIQGDAAGDRAGFSVSSAGDVNGDGFADLIVGALFGGDGGFFAGEAYVVFGTASGFGTVDIVTGRAVLDLSNDDPGEFDASVGFIIQGDAAGDRAGFSVSSAGDVNGDGFADLIVGALFGGDGGFFAGEAYVVFGTASGFGTVDIVTGRAVLDLSNLGSSFDPAKGFIIQGDAADDTAGYSVSAAGDVNGDGFADLIVGAPRGDDGGYNAGEAYVVFGTASGFGAVDGTGRAVLDLSNVAASFDPAKGFIIQGDAAGDLAGWSVSSAGDVNGDGFADLIVGAQFGDDGGADAGEAYVVFGRASGFGALDTEGRAVLDLSALTSSQGFIIQGDAASDQAGRSVSAAGDINGDGFDDLIVGAHHGSDGGTYAGEAYVIYGGLSGNSTAPVTPTGDGDDTIFIGGAGNDTLTGDGGADVFRGGAGNDTITAPNLDFRSLDGGSGTDTLVLTGSGQTFDFWTNLNSKTTGIEAIDITGSGDNTLILGVSDVLNFSSTGNGEFTAAASKNSLVIKGDAGDELVLGGFDPDGVGGAYPVSEWQLWDTGKGLDGEDGGDYNIYNLIPGGAGPPIASVAVDNDIVVTLSFFALV